MSYLAAYLGGIAVAGTSAFAQLPLPATAPASQPLVFPQPTYTLPDQPLVVDDMALARRAAAARDPAEALARYLRVLSREQTNLEALMGAGQAALDIGDPNGALNFYARAETIAPQNGRIKAGLGSAMVQLVQPKSALKLFEDAIDDGIPVTDIAADRGLAYDLRGDNKRARADYELALRTRPSAETTRRLALSIAMSGDPLGALATIDDLLRKQDKAAWRDRAFILAISGDVKGAEDTARAVLLRPQAQALEPFLARIAKLKPSQQAAAVHFGQFPSDGKQYSEAEMFAAAGIEMPVAPPASSMAKRPDSKGSDLADDQGDGIGIDKQPPLKAVPMKITPSRQVAVKQSLSERAKAAPKPALATPPFVPDRAVTTSSTALVQSDFELPAKSSSKSDTARKPKLKPLQLADAAPVQSAPSDKTTKAYALSKEKSAASEKAAKDKIAKDKADKDKVAKDKASSDKSTADKAGKAKAASAQKSKVPERYWVQVATGAYKPDLGKAWGKLKEKYPALLGRQTPSTVPLNRTNRLLIGPFKSADDAQAFVNKTAGAGFITSPYTSPAGQNVDRVN